MAAGPDDDNGNGNRATVALVSEQVHSLTKLSEARFKSLQREINSVVVIAGTVTELVTKVALLEAAVSALKKDRDDDAQSSVTTKQFVLGVLTIAVMIGIAVIGRVGT